MERRFLRSQDFILVQTPGGFRYIFHVCCRSTFSFVSCVSKEFFFFFFFFDGFFSCPMFVSSSVQVSPIETRHCVLIINMGLNAERGKEREKKNDEENESSRAATAAAPDCSLLLSFSFVVVYVTHSLCFSLSLASLYISFQPISLTLSVSRNKETCESKHTTITTVVKHNRNFGMFVFFCILQSSLETMYNYISVPFFLV